jgi:hypothetical protein
MCGFRTLLSVLAVTVAVVVGFSWAADAQTEKRVALVIGNGKYTHAAALPNPANDARAVAQALGQIGFDVVQGTDLDRNGMEQRLREFLNRANSAQVALIFYAGHGLQVDGRNYLVPVDARLETQSDLNFGAIDLDRVLSSLDDPARANVIILDACRDNPLARNFAAKTRSAAVGAGLAAYTSLGTGTLISFSTAPGKVASDGTGINSPFTEHLVRHLRTPGLEVRQMLTRVRADVAAATGEKQVPWDNSSLRGDVYLAGRAAAAAPIAPVMPSPAQPAALPPTRMSPDHDALIRFGLLGTFAMNCRLPPSANNVHLTYALSEHGHVTSTLNNGGSGLPSQHIMKDIQLVANDRLSYSQLGSGFTFRVVIRKSGERHRSVDSVRSDGAVLIKGEVFTKFNRETPWFEKCGQS